MIRFLTIGFYQMKKFIVSSILIMSSFMQVTFAAEVIPPNLVGQWWDDETPEVITFKKEGTFQAIGSMGSTGAKGTVNCLMTIEGTITSIQKTDAGYRIQGSGKTIPGGLIPMPGNTVQECQQVDGGFTHNVLFNISKITDGSFTMGGERSFRKIFKVLDGKYCQK